MTIGTEGLQLIADFEGFEPEAYLCPAGVWTLGFGETLGVRPGDRISRAEAKCHDFFRRGEKHAP